MDYEYYYTSSSAPIPGGIVVRASDTFCIRKTQVQPLARTQIFFFIYVTITIVEMSICCTWFVTS